MIVQYLAIAALLGSAICLLAHQHFDAAIRHLRPLSVDNAATRQSAVESYRKLDGRRITACLGVIGFWAICAGLWMTPQFSAHWSNTEQIAFKAVACIIFLVSFVMIELHNFDRDSF